MSPSPLERAYLGWPALVLRAGDLEATLVPSCGGRVLRLAVAGLELFYAEPRPPAWPPPSRCYWGGEKTWLAPQSAWGGDFPAPRVLDEGEYEARPLDGGAVEMRSPVSPEGLRIVRTVRLEERALAIDVRLENHGREPVARAVRLQRHRHVVCQPELHVRP